MCFAVSRGVSPGWSPRVARPRLPSARSVCSLVYRGPRLPAPSSGRDYAGQSLSSCRVRRSSGCSGGGGGGRTVRVPACAAPLHSPRVSRCGTGSGRAAVGSRSHLSPRFLARVFRRVRPSRGRLRLGRSRGAVVPRVMRCGVLSGCAVVASLPLPRQRSHGWWNRRSPPPPSGPGGPVSRVMGLALGGGPFWGNDGWSRPARRRTSGPAAA